MNQTSLDNPGGAADDGHIARIVRLETQMDNVTSALLSLQRAQEAQHQAMMAEFASLRDRIDDVRKETMARIDQSAAATAERFERLLATTAQQTERSIDRQDQRIEHQNNRFDQLSNRIDHLSNRIDRLVFWMAGLMITNVVTVVGLLLRVAGAI
jgi:exonuclease VII large subunit